MADETLKQNNKKFIVEIERIERYYNKVAVIAKDEQEATKKVGAYDLDNGFENEWNELQPDVTTHYYATAQEDAGLTDGEISHIDTIPL